VKGFLATVGSTESSLTIAGGRHSSLGDQLSKHMFHIGNKNPVKMFPIGNTAPSSIKGLRP